MAITQPALSSEFELPLLEEELPLELVEPLFVELGVGFGLEAAAAVLDVDEGVRTIGFDVGIPKFSHIDFNAFLFSL